jgi:site-specific recombinase XerD
MRRGFRFGHPVGRWYRVGPLRDYLDEYATRLGELQYARECARQKIKVVSDLSRWLEHERLGVRSLDDHLIAKFFRQRRQRHNPVFSGDMAAIRLLQDLLRERGVLPELPPPEDRRHTTEIVFEQYLREERRVSPSTLASTLRFVHHFLADLFGAKSVGLASMSPADITGFVLQHARTMSPARAKRLACALRSYLRFLYLRAEITTDLAAVVPTVPGWRLTGVPKSIDPQQVEALLKSCTRRTPTGRRDYAILLLLARLGLRGGEVSSMTLDDIDWEAGELLVRGKGYRHDRLPIPKDVGEAVVAYLRDGRPRCASRHVFLTSRAPVHELRRSVGAIVLRAIDRAGIDAPHKGSHLLRHSLAVQMLQRGASLGEIGEILRHRHLDTTAIYAKVDLNALRSLAQSWPGGAA